MKPLIPLILALLFLLALVPSAVAEDSFINVIPNATADVARVAADDFEEILSDGEWVLMNPDRLEPAPLANLHCVVIPDGTILATGYIGETGVVRRSTDRGASWTLITDNPGWSSECKLLTVLSDGTIIRISNSDAWQSTDQGATWTQLHSNEHHTSRWYEGKWVALPDESIVKMGGFENRWGLTESFNDVWRSTDFGASWTLMAEHAEWSRRRSFDSVVLPDGSIVLMGGYNKNDVWRSEDMGATWTCMTENAGWLENRDYRSVVLSDGRIVLMGSNDVWRSEDMGVTWTQVSDDPECGASNVGDAFVLPDNSIVRIHAYSHGVWQVWRSTDQGESWFEMAADRDWSARSNPLSVALPDGSIVLMGGFSVHNEWYSDVWKSTDLGATWTLVTDNAEWEPSGSQSSVLLPDGSIVLINTNSVWRSTDQGNTWLCMRDNGFPSGHSTVALPDGSIVVMGGQDGPQSWRNWIIRSEDMGATWTSMRGGGPIWDPREGHTSVVLPDGSIVVMGGSAYSPYNDVWRSEDMGATWTCMTDNAEWGGGYGVRSVVLPDGSIVLMGSDGIWRSEDMGATWTRMEDAAWMPRASHTSVVLPGGSIVIMGGVRWEYPIYRKFNDVWRLETGIISSLFNSGETVEVQNTLGVGLVVRDTPAGEQIDGRFDGARGVIIGGPQSAEYDGVTYTWWEIRWADGVTGWSAQGEPGGAYWLRKVEGAGPTKPQNIQPEDNSIDFSPYSTFFFSEYEHPIDGMTHCATQWRITEERGNYTNSVLYDEKHTVLTQSSIPTGLLEHATTYYWQVRYQDETGAWSVWSDETSFTTLNEPNVEFEVIEETWHLKLDASGTCSNYPDGEIISYVWCFTDSDGNTIETITLHPEVVLNWLPVGVYDVTLEIIDSLGGSASAVGTIEIDESAYGRMISILSEFEEYELVNIHEQQIDEYGISTLPSSISDITKMYRWVRGTSDVYYIDEWIRSIDTYKNEPAFFWIDNRYDLEDVVYVLNKEVTMSNDDQVKIPYKFFFMSILEEEMFVHSAYRPSANDVLYPRFTNRMRHPHLMMAFEKLIGPITIREIAKDEVINFVATKLGLKPFDSIISLGFELLDAKTHREEMNDMSYLLAFVYYLQERDSVGPYVHTDWRDMVKSTFDKDIYSDSGFGRRVENTTKTDEYIRTSQAHFDKIIKQYEDEGYVTRGRGFSDAYRKETRNKVIFELNKLLHSYKNELPPKRRYIFFSPIELRVYDENNRITGLVDGVIVENIDNSVYFPESNKLVVYKPDQVYQEKLIGTGDGTYGLSMVSRQNREDNPYQLTFTNIPIVPQEVHHYSVQWDKLSDVDSITISKDYDGDGSINEIITTSRPNIPYNPSPADNASKIVSDTELAWEGGSPDLEKELLYNIYISNDTPSNLRLIETIGPYTGEAQIIQYKPEPLQLNTNYHWKVVAQDSTSGLMVDSPVWSFTTIPETTLMPHAVIESNINYNRWTSDDVLVSGTNDSRISYFTGVHNTGQSDGSINGSISFLLDADEVLHQSVYPAPYAEINGTEVRWNFPETTEIQPGTTLSTSAATSIFTPKESGVTIERTTNRTQISEAGIQEAIFNITFDTIHPDGLWGRVECANTTNISATFIPGTIRTDLPLFALNEGMHRIQFRINPTTIEAGRQYFISAAVAVNPDTPIIFAPGIAVWEVINTTRTGAPNGTMVAIPDSFLPENATTISFSSATPCTWEIVRNDHIISSINQRSEPIERPPLIANFTATPTSGASGFTVRFNDTSTGDPDEWFWEFGDGSNSTEQNPVHTYTSPGTYNVTLTAINAGGNDTVTEQNLITVHIRGDFNGNGRVDIGDVAKVAWMAIGLIEPDPAANFKDEGEVDAADAARIAYYYVGKIPAL